MINDFSFNIFIVCNVCDLCPKSNLENLYHVTCLSLNFSMGIMAWEKNYEMIYQFLVMLKTFIRCVTKWIKTFFLQDYGKQKRSKFVTKYGNKESENEAFSKLPIYMPILGL